MHIYRGIECSLKVVTFFLLAAQFIICISSLNSENKTKNPMKTKPKKPKPKKSSNTSEQYVGNKSWSEIKTLSFLFLYNSSVFIVFFWRCILGWGQVQDFKFIVTYQWKYKADIKINYFTKDATVGIWHSFIFWNGHLRFLWTVGWTKTDFTSEMIWISIVNG